jgi:hypothetical protein
VVSCRLSATGVRFSGHPVPAGELGLPHGRLTTRHDTRGWTPSGFPRSALTRYDRVGCPLYPGDQRCSPDRMPCPTSACRIPTARPCTPPKTSHRAELRFTRHQQGFTRFTRPVCPSPVILSMGREPLRLSPRASHPAVTSSARQRQGQAASTRPGLHHRHHVGPPNCESTRKVRHRVATADPDARVGIFAAV